jgi:hypothetical protein
MSAIPSSVLDLEKTALDPSRPGHDALWQKVLDGIQRDLERADQDDLGDAMADRDWDGLA